MTAVFVLLIVFVVVIWVGVASSVLLLLVKMYDGSYLLLVEPEFSVQYFDLCIFLLILAIEDAILLEELALMAMAVGDLTQFHVEVRSVEVGLGPQVLDLQVRIIHLVAVKLDQVLKLAGPNAF